MSFHLKYRPDNWNDVIGQASVISSLSRAIENRSGQAFAFTGPSGVGKTTLARICAKELGCTNDNLMEVDAATHTGVDAWREIRSHFPYPPMGGGARAIIVDEAHMLSRSAWNSLLKDLEEPPKWLYWFLCTTEAPKIPKTIRTRCLAYELAPVGQDDLFDLLQHVVEGEGVEVSEDVLDVVARNAEGSPREALTMLAQVWEAEDLDDARVILRAASETGDAFKLAQALAQGANWMKVRKLLIALSEQNPESVRMVIQAYMTKVVLGAKSEEKALVAMDMLEPFSEPYTTTNSLAPLILSVGEVICGDK